MVDRSSIPHAPGVYLMRDSSGAILYIGKARDLARRVASYFQARADAPVKTAALVAAIHHIDYIPAASERDALLLEQQLIRRVQPVFNTMWKDDKTYPWVKLTWGEDFPRMLLTRKNVRDGSKYFGPFPDVTLIRRLLRHLWRGRLFPLRPCRYEFSESNPLPLEKAKDCLYYHTRECPAPCVGRITREGYRAIARGAELFFLGRHRQLARAWESEMKEASRHQEFERAAVLRDSLAALAHMNERVLVREIDAASLDSQVERARGITELQNALALARPPVRIECFDISHFQGTETVASMVSFAHGKPDKAGYRKFKIKTVAGIDDFASMGEVVGRRYRRLGAEGKPLPDLILIDGGKGQLSAAQTALSAVLGTRRLPPLASLAKREEELFVPNRPDPIVLPKDSPALLLVQRVRDEAHRFAITFHRHRRKKTFLTVSTHLKMLPKSKPSTHY